jgi:hypothetical protein
MRRTVILAMIAVFCLGLMGSGCAWMDRDPSRPMTDMAQAARSEGV